MQLALLKRVFIIALLMALLWIPLLFIHGVVSDRQQLQYAVERTIAASSAESQRIVGPILVLPYVEREEITTKDEKGKKTTQVVEHSRLQYFVPETLSYDGTVDVESRYKGIYKAMLYRTKGDWSAQFDTPANWGLAGNKNVVSIGEPYLSIGISDIRGLGGATKVIWNGRSLAIDNGAQFQAFGDGLNANIGAIDVAVPRRHTAHVSMDLLGTSSLAIAPIGKNTVVQLKATWPHPNFGGRFLPQSKTIDAYGFTARWEVSHLASKNTELLKGGVSTKRELEQFDVSFIEPVNIYQQAERAVKYGILFIALTFAGFFLFETLMGLRIHPLQYGLVGLALAIFFLLLVSLSEHIAFGLAYLIAGSGCVLLIGYYLAHVLGGWRRGAGFTAKLVVLHGVLYGLLLSEDNALMLGAILLFIVLAVMMVLTRKVNWYQFGDVRADMRTDMRAETQTEAPDNQSQH